MSDDALQAAIAAARGVGSGSIPLDPPSKGELKNREDAGGMPAVPGGGAEDLEARMLANSGLPESERRPLVSTGAVDVSRVPWVGVDPARAGSEVTVEVEAVLKGCLMRIRYRGVRPGDVPELLRGEDPEVKFRDQFFTKGGGGRKDVECARAQVITVTKSAKFTAVQVLGNTADGTVVEVRVSKAKMGGFCDLVAGLGKVPEAEVSKLRGVLDAESGGTTFVMVQDAWAFGVQYFTTDDGAHFLDSLVPDAPTVGGDNAENTTERTGDHG